MRLIKNNLGIYEIDKYDKIIKLCHHYNRINPNKKLLKLYRNISFYDVITFDLRLII